MTHFATLTAAIAAMLLASSASAATLAFTASPAASTVAPGGTATINLFLLESGANPVIAAEGGLFSVGFAVRRISGTGTITAFTPDTATFNVGPATSTGATQSTFYGEITTLVPYDSTVGPKPDAQGLIPLGSVTIQGLTGDTLFEIGDISAANQTTTVLGLGSLDAGIAAGTFSVVVPEPATAVLLGAASLMLRRRRHAD